MNDQVTLVDAQGNSIGVEDKLVAHRQPPQLHAAVSVWLVNGNGETLLQERSAQKIVGAGWWGNAICGNVRPTENAQACAHRRLQEEIGVTGVELQKIYSFEYQAFGNEQYSEHEWDTVFMGSFSGQPVLNPEEASQVRWVKIFDLVAAVNEETNNYPTAEETLHTALTELATLAPPVKVLLAGQTHLIAPWTVLMLKDERLQNALLA